MRRCADVGQDPQRALAVAQGVEGERQLAGLGSGHPGVGAHAAHAEARDHEVVPAVVDQRPARGAADRAAQHRVVPVHREGALVQEQVAVLAQRVPEPAPRQLPLGLLVVEQLRQRHPGPQRVVDARGTGQQRLAVDRGGSAVSPLLGPGDPAERELHRHHVVQAPPDGGPQLPDEVRVAAHQPVVPGPDREVRRHVRLAAGVLHLPGDDLERPRAVLALLPERPAVRPLGLLDAPGGHQGHGGLDVVPDVGVLAGGPRDRAGGLLHRDDRGRRRGDLGRGQHAGASGLRK